MHSKQTFVRSGMIEMLLHALFCTSKYINSSVIWNKWSRVTFFETSKISRARRTSAFVVFEKITSSYLFHIAGEKYVIGLLITD